MICGNNELSREGRRTRWNSIVCLDLIVILLLFLLVVNLEVAELVGVLSRGDHAQPITQIVLFQVLQNCIRNVEKQIMVNTVYT